MGGHHDEKGYFFAAGDPNINPRRYSGIADFHLQKGGDGENTLPETITDEESPDGSYYEYGGFGAIGRGNGM